MKFATAAIALPAFNHKGKPRVTKLGAVSYGLSRRRLAPKRTGAVTADMNRFIAGCFAFGVLIAAQCAAAADLSVAPLYKAPPAPLPQVYNWTGLYVGANGGGGWGNSWWNANTTGINLSGAMVGGTAGYNVQFGNTVFGLEGDIDWQHLSGTAATPLCPGCTTSDNWLSTVRGRIGYAFDRVMPYVTGGLAVGDIRAAAPGFSGGSSTNAGWALGAGVEIALPGNWTAKAEYLRVDLGSFNCGTGCSTSPTGNVSLQENVFRAGVNYHFGWSK
jgi:outer membrane immunogenic protein